MTGLRKLAFALFRGGTSRGPVLLESALPRAAAERDDVLLRLMGSPRRAPPSARVCVVPPEPRTDPGPTLSRRLGPAACAGIPQVDGLGGGASVTSKAVLVGPSPEPRVDVNYLVCEVDCRRPVVETSIDCGNMLAAVAPFAVAQRMVTPGEASTTVRIRSGNTGVRIDAVVATPGGKVHYDNEETPDGQPATGTVVALSFLEPGGTTCGRTLPTGTAKNVVDGVELSCVDVSMPMVIVPASAVGKTGSESKAELDADVALMDRLEFLRQAAAREMGLGEVAGQIMPKICLVAPPVAGGTLLARYMVAPFNHDAHASMAITGALCLGGACTIAGTVAHALAARSAHDVQGNTRRVVIEHPAGTLEVRIRTRSTPAGPAIAAASYSRTARLLAEGVAYLPG